MSHHTKFRLLYTFRRKKFSTGRRKKKFEKEKRKSLKAEIPTAGTSCLQWDTQSKLIKNSFQIHYQLSRFSYSSLFTPSPHPRKSLCILWTSCWNETQRRWKIYANLYSDTENVLFKWITFLTYELKYYTENSKFYSESFFEREKIFNLRKISNSLWSKCTSSKCCKYGQLERTV